MNESTVGVDLVDIHKSFSNGSETLSILRGVSLSVAPGESLAIVGPSGSGKSTLLQIIGTLDRPDSGTVRLAGVDPLEMTESALAAFRNENIGFIFQDHHLLPQLSVLENVLIPALAGGTPDGARVDRARDLCESLGLGNRITHRPAQLSGGQRERVAIARALVMQPRMVLADEPTGNLDSHTAGQVTELLAELPRQQDAVLITVTHSDDLAQAMDDAQTLDQGQLG